MSYNKFQSKLFPPDFSQIPQRLKTHTPKNGTPTLTQNQTT